MKANRLLLTAVLALSSVYGVEATDYIRYVSKSQGAYNNDGLSWKTAKMNVQDAINDIKDKLEPGDKGYVFVEAGTYKPTQSVGGASNSTLYMSIQIPSGVSIYGGFEGTETGSNAKAIISQRQTVTTSIGTQMKNKTIFTGSLSSEAQFSWNAKKNRYNTSFFGNCYHVIWFATNGYETDATGVKRYNALSDSAFLDGVVIKDGYAFNSDINKVDHIAFGGGAYMVDKAVIRNCEVYHCESSRGGGGIYMDRGGKVENTFVHDCQTLGVNSLTGFGGGIAVDQQGLVTHCTLLNNVGRSGGGLSLSYDASADVKGLGKYAACASACLVAQNVSIVEGGGVYLDKGGLLNGVTIVRNRTYGTGVTLNGIVTGRSGGLYIRDHARVYNSVLWGNKTTAHNTYDLQYASSRSSADNSLKPLLTYLALSKADYTDWSGSKKVGINKLSEEETMTFSTLEKYTMFKAGCDSTGHVDYQKDPKISSAAKYLELIDWTPTSSSGLCYAGLQLLDIVENEGADLTTGYIYQDLKGNDFNPKCTLGAYTAEAETPQDTQIDGVHTLFVDPERVSGKLYTNPGISWDSPLDNLTDALNYFAQKGYAGQIFVKEGTLSTASRYASGRLRGTSIPMVSNVKVIGGYPAQLTGTNLTQVIESVTYGRNPVEYPTIISGKVSEKDYKSNVAHLVMFDGVENSTLDGFQLRWGNASSTVIADYGLNGAGIIITNGSKVNLKNLTIADCTAQMGAAIYQESGSVVCENCIFRNNESSTTTPTLSGGVLYVGAQAAMTLDHCDVVRNVGHAVAGYGLFTSTNSLYYSNMREVVEDTNDKGDKALPSFLGSGSFAGDHNLFDIASSTLASTQSMGQAILDWDFETSSFTYPRFVNSTKNAGISEDGDVTYYGRKVDYTPSDMNPAVNAASTGGVAHRTGQSDDSWGYDMTTVAARDFGGLPDIGALENGAFTTSSATQPAFGSTYYVRDYHTYNSNGECTSTDFNTTHSDGTMRDGYSWKNAINGNAKYNYTSNGVTLPINGLQYAVNMMHDNLGLSAARTVTKKENSKNNTLTYYDLPSGKTDGEVWVAAGIYTKPEGFVMRNHVKVLGGFPKTGNPGLQERHPQLSSGIAMSEENKKLNLNYRDYETILQTNAATAEKLINTVNAGLKIEELSIEMCKQWSAATAGAIVTNDSPAREIHFGQQCTNGGVVYGTGSVNYLTYADLSGYKSMTIKGTGSARCLFNRLTDGGNLTDKTYQLSESGVTIDLSEIDDNPFVHLHAIKAPWGQNCTINSITLVSKSDSDGTSNELTDFAMDLDDKTFIVTAQDGESIFYFNATGTVQNTKTGKFADLKNSADNYYFMRFNRVTDYTSNSYEGDVYTIQLYNINGQKYGSDNADEGFLNAQTTGDILFASGAKGTQYGQDGSNLALWRVGNDGHGFYIQNVERARNNRNSYITPTSASPQQDRVYVRLFAQGGSVLCHAGECRPTVYPDNNVYESRVIYEGTEWDGFTIRNGFKLGVYLRYNSTNKQTSSGRRNGGAGVSIYENAKVTNCIIRQNNLAGKSVIGRGGGVYCDGGSIINCYVMDNVSSCEAKSQNYGGGIYMITGTLYNTVIAHNEVAETSEGHGAGIFMESASFYNNTIVDNTGADAIGIYKSHTTEAARLTVYNTIVIAAPGKSAYWRFNTSSPVIFDHCYLQQTTAALKNVIDNDKNLSIKNCIFGYSDQNKWDSFGPFVKSYSNAIQDRDYRITTVGKGQVAGDTDRNNNCVNAGTEKIGLDYLNRPAVLPANDMDWTDRIQDCRVDIGAYEFNGAGSITPDENVNRTGGENIKVYYVTELGFGTTQANDPANAACAQKLQKVLDAAGRYKYEHPTARVIVKLAGVDATAAGYQESSCFKYYPCRTTDEENDNVRLWSIMVPRGIEVWGGYTVEEVLDETTNEKIAPCFSDDERSVMYHPTYLQTQYDNSKLNETVKGYHVVTFTDKTFDENGDEIKGATLSSAGVTDRAVLDGLFLVGGKADGESYGSSSTTQNNNQYGGAAIVTDFAHVRNCILKDNEASYGGALALMNKGLVSGCLIIDNVANYGGGVYVVEDDVTLSTYETNNTKNGTGALDENMPHVYTTTVVKNTGNMQGGGLWFSNDADQPNIRVNSSVLWQNDSPDQANVAGQTSPDMPTENLNLSTFEWYPFAYSAVQNLRLSGTSNISVAIQNKQGTRFGKDSKTNPETYDGKTYANDTTEVDYYGLTVFSALCRTGMPLSSYEELVKTMQLSEYDFNNWRRDTVPNGRRTYVDIGARAYPSSPAIDLEHPFLRLYVAQTQDVNMDAFDNMQDYAMSADVDDPNYIYSLLGSSFAYPFQNLDDALAYIGEVRKCDIWEGCANNMPFEICVARGEYYPQRDMQGNYGYSLANTFLIPEGVTLMGGFDCNNIYGQYLKPVSKDPAYYTTNLAGNVARFSNDTLNAVGSGKEEIRISQLPLDEMAERRVLEDLNFNNILEPWEFRNQTNLSGNTVNLQNSGVYHVVSVIPYAPGVGALPTPVSTNKDYDTNGRLHGYGREARYVGQPVIIDGVHISDGYARDYVKGSLNDIGIYDYYRGAGIRANGNWYCTEVDRSDEDLKHADILNAVAYRDIPLYIRNTQFINNQAGYGAALDANVSTYIYNCLFAQNKAISKEENINWVMPLKSSADYNKVKSSTVSYPGNGGAVCFNGNLEAYNTIFSNNEAEDSQAISNHVLSSREYKGLTSAGASVNGFGGAGAALCGGYYSHMKVLNCDFVNNQASIYPAIYTKNPNYGLDATSQVTEADYNLVANNVFWGNQVHKNVGSKNPFAQALCINYSNANCISNVSGRYDISLDKAPKNQEDLDANFSEALWFSAYEKGRAQSSLNYNDLRELNYSPSEYIGSTLRNYWIANYAIGGSTYTTQNANITLSSENESLEGPNFCNPSTEAGYHGYNEAADWSRARLNNLTDNGNGFLTQSVENAGSNGYTPSWQTSSDNRYQGDGAYYDAHYMTAENERSLDLGDDIYMRSVDEGKSNMSRIASDPNPGRSIAYIDLGVYEYPYCRLVPETEGDAVDILWVSTVENTENGTPDGSSWETPTSDLQRAIETLLSSRNGHRKEIRLMDGEYSPINTYGDHKSFYINTKNMNSSVVFDANAYDKNGNLNTDPSHVSSYFVRSLTIKGGYSKDLRDQYDTELYPSVIRSSERIDGTSNTWDYLFLIDDAIQRYGKGDDADKAYGALDGNAKEVTTIPIEFDGLTLVNNQALPGTHGAAIRYNDQVFTFQNGDNTYTYYANAPASANVSITKEEYDELSKDPSVQLERTYWTDETYTTKSETPTDFAIYCRVVENPAKLTISKCCIMNSGSHYDASTQEDYSSSAVYIGQYGGDALIYNSVFHSNWGNPLEAFNTRTINNTVALNHGRWILKNSGSVSDLFETGSGEGTGEMLAPRPRYELSGTVQKATYEPRKSNIMNTIMWRNNPVTNEGNTIYGNQFVLDGYISETAANAKDIFSRNAYTHFINGEADVTEGTDYNDFKPVHWNTHLSLTNDNISTGPNFKDPKLDAADAEIENRDFSLMPSVRIINKGDTSIYANEVFDLAWIPTTEKDYLSQPRVLSQSIEVGAIEYQQPLLRVIYVDPTKTENGDGTGWGTTMNSENLQNAIDLAAIYSAANSPAYDEETGAVKDLNESYVFVKGDNEVKFPEVTLRNGVNIYASIDPNNVTDSVYYQIDERSGDYIYPNLRDDVEKIVNSRPGLLSPGTKRTTVPAVTTGENNSFDSNRPTRIDGVVISATSSDNSNGAILNPVLDINPTPAKTGEAPAVALSHIMVADNNAEGGNNVNIANVDNALLYEVLFRDNAPSAGNYVLNLGANAYGVNLTVEGRTNDAAGQCKYATADNSEGSHLWYSIYNYSGKPADENTLSAYNYPMFDRNLNYQLTEQSANIDRCPAVNPMETEAKNLAQFIHYATDLDLLGNPRVLSTSAASVEKPLDRGAFEIWRIGNTEGQTIYSDVSYSNYGGNYYPHEGSVVYLMENSNLISEAHELIPGYLLVKRGASLFGHGQTIKAAYVGVEREIEGNGTVVALPYAMQYGYKADNSHGPATFAYDEEGVLTLATDANAAAYTYNGDMRSAARYQLQNNSSPCWNLMSADASTAACQGVLFIAGNDAVYRFTGRGSNVRNYIYVEQPQLDAEDNLITTAQSVILTPFNHEPKDGNGLLTAAEDMGWNCFGIPYLVSEYKPYEMAYDMLYNSTATEEEYMMHLPKQLWLYYDGLQTLNEFGQINNWSAANAKNYAGFYAVESWNGTAADWHLNTTPSLWVGEGMFAQTASYTDEDLRFYLPIYRQPGLDHSESAPVRQLKRLYVKSAIEEDLEQNEAVQDTIYDLQGRKVQAPSGHGIYVVNGKRVWM